MCFINTCHYLCLYYTLPRIYIVIWKIILILGSGEGGMKLGLGFKEEGAADLRSSTEELDFTDDPIGENRQRRDSQRSLRKRSGSVSKYELEAQSEKERKDSLSIMSTGRTSRLSSIGKYVDVNYII